MAAAGVPAHESARLSLAESEIAALAAAAPADDAEGNSGPPTPEAMQKTVASARAAVKAVLTVEQTSRIREFLTREMGPRPGGLGDGPPNGPDDGFGPPLPATI